MTEQQVWIIPGDPNDLAPLPVLQYDETHFSDYDRRKQIFGAVYEHHFMPTYDTFEECRTAMVGLLAGTLEESNKHCRWLAQSIEHIKFIPTAPFPNVSREVREQDQGQQQEEAKGPKEKAQGRQEAVKPPPQLKKRPSRS
jgi:hypothetical protein